MTASLLLNMWKVIECKLKKSQECGTFCIIVITKKTEGAKESTPTQEV